MIITRTPFRISFFGGGTDYPVYYQEHGGAVLSTTINKYCYLTVRDLPPFFDHAYRIRYTQKEQTNSIDEIQHPSVRECLKFVGINKGIEMIHTSDIPARSGIGSSSSFTVGFLNSLYALQGKMVTKRKLALDAMHVEQHILKENVGSQDQVAAAFGGFNKIEFGGSDGIFVRPITIPASNLEYIQSCSLFYFTGFSRTASEIALEQIGRTKQNKRELALMREMVDEAIGILNGGADHLDEFGALLHEAWALKKTLSTKITTSQIDEMYEIGKRAGALGGKVCGAGGGGFVVFFVPPDRQAEVKEALKNFLLVPIRFENLGSHVIYYAQ